MQTITFSVDDADYINLVMLAKIRGQMLPDGTPDFARVYEAATREAKTHVRLAVGEILANDPVVSAQMLAAVETHLEAEEAAKTAAMGSQEPATPEPTITPSTTEDPTA